MALVWLLPRAVPGKVNYAVAEAAPKPNFAKTPAKVSGAAQRCTGQNGQGFFGKSAIELNDLAAITPHATFVSTLLHFQDSHLPLVLCWISSLVLEDRGPRTENCIYKVVWKPPTASITQRVCNGLKRNLRHALFVSRHSYLPAIASYTHSWVSCSTRSRRSSGSVGHVWSGLFGI